MLTIFMRIRAKNTYYYFEDWVCKTGDITTKANPFVPAEELQG
jgi:hypothetical protein